VDTSFTADESDRTGEDGTGGDATQPGDDGSASSGSSEVTSASSGGGTNEVECPYEGPPQLDVNTLEPCPTAICAGGSHCIPAGLVDAEQAEMLADCDATNKCVPDNFIESLGNTIPESCASLLGSEGRCLSRCIPQVAERADSLPQDICGEHEVCVPCYDPIDGEDTSACTLMCDPGPAEPPPEPLPSCCDDGGGTCVPLAAIPDDQEEQLDEDSCSEDQGGDGEPVLLCVPNQLLDPTWQPVQCETSGGLLGGFFGNNGGKPGACYPECLGAVKSLFVNKGSCDSGYKCAPCKHPLTGKSTGACPWEP